jgi:hypothetical protein
MKKMKNIKIILGLLLLITACDNDLDQFPPKIASSSSLTDFTGVLNGAYYYQSAAVTPMAVMGDFRADNAHMTESPYTEFDLFTSDLVAMNNQFFGPFYSALYKSILSANNVIENSSNAVQVGEAKFVRALSYFKLVLVFGDVPVNLSAAPNPSELSIFKRQPASSVYNDVIIPDLEASIAALGTARVIGRASKYAAQGLLGKVYMHMGNFAMAETHLGAVVNGAAAAGISLKSSYAAIFGVANETGNTEMIFVTKIQSSVVDEYGFSEFWQWYFGLDTKSLAPLDADLDAAFDAIDAADGGGKTDSRRAVIINAGKTASPKFPQTGGADHDWIELRLADVLLLYAEALNENGKSNEALVELNKVHERAGLSTLTSAVLSTQALVRQAIYDERRVELAFEGNRWFDLVRTGTVNVEMGQTIDSRYHLFPVPLSEILATNGVITQNPGY